MKRTLIKATVVGMFLIGSIYFMKKESTKTSGVVFDNIEALAAGEGGGSMWFCRGVGSLDCPSGNKVEYIVDDYR